MPLSLIYLLFNRGRKKIIEEVVQYLEESVTMLDLLEGARIFEGCSTQHLQDVARVCERISVEEGERIFEAKAPAEYFYVVTDGVVKLCCNVNHYNALNEISLERNYKGDAFGWSALVEPYIYTLSAIAGRDSELLKISGMKIRKMSMDDDHFGSLLMGNLTQIIGERFVSVQQILIEEIQHTLKEKELSR
jgi:CRP-like cAMP-binding protein